MDARSLNDLRNLTHAMRETLTHLQKEEDLFTGKADLLASEYTGEDLKCMLSTLRETSRKLAIVLAAALCDPNDNARMATGGIHVQDQRYPITTACFHSCNSSVVFDQNALERRPMMPYACVHFSKNILLCLNNT